MILIDYSQVVMANLYVNLHQGGDASLDTIRHMTLNTIRKVRTKFKREYGEVVICVDAPDSWRFGVFPYYKASRKVAREESDLDWKEIFDWIRTIREELIEHFPYKVMLIPGCEADDIIGTLIHEHGRIVTIEGEERHLILSSDKDFIQLHRYGNVSQYANQRDEFVVHSNPEEYLKMHIYKGDSGDGIPNVLSPDNSLVMKIRQKPVTKKQIGLLDIGEYDEETLKRLDRNRQLIDLKNTPEDLQKKILEEFQSQVPKGARRDLMSYFAKNRLKLLMDDLDQF